MKTILELIDEEIAEAEAAGDMTENLESVKNGVKGLLNCLKEGTTSWNSCNTSDCGDCWTCRAFALLGREKDR